MESMFALDTSLTSIDVSSFDTSSVTDMIAIFNDCESLTTLNLCSFDTSNASTSYIFGGDSKLTNLYIGPKFTITSETLAYTSVVTPITDECDYISKDNKIKVNLSTSSTTNSITLVASSESSEISKYEYSIDGGTTYKESTKNNYTFTGLKQGTTYRAKVKVTDSNGNIGISSIQDVVTSEIDVPTYTENGNVVTINYPEGCGSKYTCSYIKDGGSEVSVTSTDVQVTFNDNGTLIAKVNDGTNYISGSTFTFVLTKISDLKTKVVTSGDGLYSDSYESDRYVYRGKSPDNYITFNGETYRIVSIESDNTLKIIRDESIGNIEFDPGYYTSAFTNGSYSKTDSSTDNTRYSSVSTDYCYYSSSASSYYGCNVWGSKTTMYDSSGNQVSKMPRSSGSSTTYDLPESESYINAYLNGTKYMGYDLTDTYYGTLSEESKSYIEKHWFNVGSTNYSSNLGTTINQEKAYKWQGNIGLLNSSDYVRASNNASCTSESSAASSPYPSKDNNYLFNSTYWFTITPNSGFSNNVRSVRGNGIFANDVAYIKYGVRPVLYLKSSIKLKGSGTVSDPYTIVSK
jgi:surface protein